MHKHSATSVISRKITAGIAICIHQHDHNAMCGAYNTYRPYIASACSYHFILFSPLLELQVSTHDQEGTQGTLQLCHMGLQSSNVYLRKKGFTQSEPWHMSWSLKHLLCMPASTSKGTYCACTPVLPVMLLEHFDPHQGLLGISALAMRQNWC